MLKLNNVTKKYFDDKEHQVIALEDINLELPDVGLVVICGTSGCGKTTILNILSGLDQPTEGELYLNDARIDNENEDWWDSFRGSYLGFIYQDYNLLENMTVKENIELPLALSNIEENSKQEKIAEVVSKLGISEYLNKKTGKLSGGQKQRVAIARALATDSRIILADEPTGNLDRNNSIKVFEILKNIAQTRLVVVVTHDSSLASIYSDRLINISYGKIESDTINEQVFDALASDITTDNEKKKLGIKNCLNFAKQAIMQRKLRCIISSMIFTITLLIIMLLCELIFRNDSIPITEYVIDSKQSVLQIYKNVPDEYINLVSDDKLTMGKKLYNLLNECVDESRIIRVGQSSCLKLDNENVYINNIYVNKSAKMHFVVDGKFPESENEIAISKDLASKIENVDKLQGKYIDIEGKKYIITAILKCVGDKNIENIYVNDGSEDNVFSNIVLHNDSCLRNIDTSEGMYMSGLGVVEFQNLFYQTTVYNMIGSSNDELELLEGRMPEKDNEILISQDLLELREVTKEEVIGKTYKLVDIYQEKYGCAYWSMINLYDYLGDNITIVGVVSGDKEYYINYNIYDDISKEYNTFYNCGYFMIVDGKEIEQDVSRLTDNDIKILDSNMNKVYDLMTNIDALKTIMLIVVLVVSALAVLQMISLYSYSINDNKKTIGILRTLGVSKSDTKRIFTIECIVISVVAFVLSIVINVVVVGIINEYINQNVLELKDFDFVRMRFSIILIAGIINYVLSMISVIIPIHKYSKIKIIKLIK